MGVGFAEDFDATCRDQFLHDVDEFGNVLLELFECDSGDRESATEVGICLEHVEECFGGRNVASLSYTGEDVVVGEIVIVVVVIADVEETITFQTEWLMYLEIKTNCFHELIYYWLRRKERWLILVDDFVVDVDYFRAGFVPCDLVDFVQAVLTKLVVHSRVCYDRVYCVGHCVDVPVVGLDDVA